MPLRRWFANLAGVSFLPRTTMRRILDEGGGGWLLLVFLALVSGFFGDFNAPEFYEAVRQRPVAVSLLVVCVFLAVVPVMLGLFWLFSWGATVLGRRLEGTGQVREVRLSLAWGLAPVIWALLYRIPLSFTGLTGNNDALVIDRGFRFDPDILGKGCGVALVLMFVELGLTAWFLTVASRTLAEAHRYSAWRGFATLLLCFAVPLAAIAAAILTAVT